MTLRGIIKYFSTQNRLTTANLLPCQGPQSSDGTVLAQAALILKSQNAQAVDSGLFGAVRCLREFFPDES